MDWRLGKGLDQMPAGAIKWCRDTVAPARAGDRATYCVNLGWRSALDILEHRGVIARGLAGDLLDHAHRVTRSQFDLLGRGDGGRFLGQRAQEPPGSGPSKKLP